MSCRFTGDVEASNTLTSNWLAVGLDWSWPCRERKAMSRVFGIMVGVLSWPSYG